MKKEMNTGSKNKMENRISYSLKATHQSFDDDEHETNSYERIFHVEQLKRQDGVIYNKALNMHFEDKTGGNIVYEIETDQMQVSLCSRLKKAEDFTRRINYLYDWFQFKVRDDGRILSIENKDELRSTWKELKETIEGDYRGDEVEAYLAEIDGRFRPEASLADPLFQYFHFALLLPQIPREHNFREWNRKRKVELSEYEKEKFEESLEFIQETDGMRHYRITGNALTASEIKIERFEGTLSCPVAHLLTEKATLEIRFGFAEHANQWNFELNRINTN